jgi:hypothetical protein
MLYDWMIFLHIFGAISFFYTHGAPGLVAFRLRSERDPQRIQAMIQIYANDRVFGLQYGTLLLLLVSGIVTGFLGEWWGEGWIWLSLILLIGITVAMFAIGTSYYTRVRKAVGMEYMVKGKVQPAEPPASPAELESLLSRSPAGLLLLIGLGGMAVIVWLMVFKPL